MHRFFILSALVVGATLIGPAVGRADDKNHHEKRYYDRSGRDYHTWNDNEDRSYRAYLQEQHRDYRQFHTVRRNEQQQYFTWRHQHPDNSRIKVEIR